MCVWKAYNFAEPVRVDAVLVVTVCVPYLCQLHISSCCLWRNSLCPNRPLPLPSIACCCFIIEKTCCNGLRGPPVWVDRKYLSVYGRVSYSRPILILNQIEKQKQNGTSISMPEITVSDTSLWLFLLFDYFFNGQNSSLMLNGII